MLHSLLGALGKLAKGLENEGVGAGLEWGQQGGNSEVWDALIFLKQVLFKTGSSSRVEEALEGGKTGGQEASSDVFWGRIQKAWWLGARVLVSASYELERWLT